MFPRKTPPQAQPHFSWRPLLPGAGDGGRRAREPLQPQGDPLTLASACCCRRDVTTTATELGALVRPTADLARAGNGLLEPSVARCPTDDQGYGSPRSVPSYTALTCSEDTRSSQSSGRSPDELCNDFSCGRPSSPAPDSPPSRARPCPPPASALAVVAPNCRLHARDAVQARDAGTLRARVSAGRSPGSGRVPPQNLWPLLSSSRPGWAPRDCARLPTPHPRYPAGVPPDLPGAGRPAAGGVRPRVGSQNCFQSVLKWLRAWGALEQGAPRSPPWPPSPCFLGL